MKILLCILSRSSALKKPSIIATLMHAPGELLASVLTNAWNTTDCSALWGQMQPLCFSYSNGLCAIIFSRQAAEKQQAGRQRLHSLVCFEMSPKIQALLKHWDISLLNINRTYAAFFFLHHILPPISRGAFFFFMRTNYRSITAHVCQLTVHWFSLQTSQFPKEMMSDLTSPGCSGITT